MLMRLLPTTRTPPPAPGSGALPPPPSLAEPPTVGLPDGDTVVTASLLLPARSRTCNRTSSAALVAGFHALVPVAAFWTPSAVHSFVPGRRYSRCRLSRSMLSSRTSQSTERAAAGFWLGRSVTTGAVPSTQTLRRAWAWSMFGGYPRPSASTVRTVNQYQPSLRAVTLK